MRPLVFRVEGDRYAWVESGTLYLLCADGWARAEVAPGLGGWVLDEAEVAALVAAHGRPQ